ncbi:MAG: hypothetical protein ACHREM_02685 [Polyangiales bacterium]
MTRETEKQMPTTTTTTARTSKRLRRRLARAGSLSLGIATFAACSSASNYSDKTPPNASPPVSKFGIHIIGAGGKSFSFTPVDAGAAPGNVIVEYATLASVVANSPAASGGTVSQPLATGTSMQVPLGTEANVLLAGGGYSFPGEGVSGGLLFLQQPLSEPGVWFLALGAGYQCGIPSVKQSPGPSFPNSIVVPPWPQAMTSTGSTGGSNPTSSSFYLLQNAPQSFDEVLVDEQFLVCVADKLAEIGDAVGNVVWDKVPASLGWVDAPPGPWTIPPQSEKDKFVAREVALNVLAHVAIFDQVWLGSGANATTASAAYARAFNDATFATSSSSTLFGDNIGAVPPWASWFQTDPTLTIGTSAGASGSLTNVQLLARDRLMMEAEILRSAERLAKEVIEKGVYSDLATAERVRAQAGDPLQGNQAAYGLTTANAQGLGDKAYDSLAHAVRTLDGRWEMNAMLDPACAGIQAMDLLGKAYGSDLDARASDVPARTDGQVAAIAAVERAGLLVPSTVLSDPATTDDALRVAVREQLLSEQVTKYGPLAASTAFTSGPKAAITDLVNALAPGDIRFALARTAGAYRQLASAKADGTTVSGRTGAMKLSAPSTTDGSAPLAGASVVAGGVSWGDLHSYDVSRAGGFQEASACPDFALPNLPVVDPPKGAPGAVPSLGFLFADQSPALAFQNSFAIGQQLRRRLVALQNQAATVTTAGPSVSGVASLAVAEAGTWAGTGMVFATGFGAVGKPPGGILVYAAGFTTDDLPGVVDKSSTSGTALGNDVALVYGEPWVAECAAHTTANCPTNFDQDYVARAVVATPSVTPSSPSETGFTGAGLHLLLFLSTNWPSNFVPAVTSATGVGDQHLYVVFSHDRAAPPGVGRVAGAVALRDNAWSALIDSPLHNDLLKATLGVAAGDSVPIPEKGKSTTANSPSYCIPGVPRDLFVPLQNDLTADSDPFENSWRQYLTLAQSAAQNADTLGQQLIQQGLDQDLRREGAQQQLTQLCGDVADTSSVTVGTNGQVQPSSADTTTQSCMDTSTVDVVMLTAEPPVGKFSSDPTAYPGSSNAANLTTWLKAQILQCDPTTPTGLCLKDTLTVQWLGIQGINYQSTPTASPDACADLVKSVQALSTTPGFDSGSAAGSVVADTWLLPDTLKGAMRSVALAAGPDSTGKITQWSVNIDGSQVMSSDPTTGLWPGCGLAGASPTCDSTSPTVTTFQNIFGAVAAPAAKVGSYTQDTLDEILWEVEGALYLAHAMSGTVHQGAFLAPVALGNFASKIDNNGSRYVPTLFGSGVYQPASSGYTFDVTADPQEVSVIGNAYIPTVVPNATARGSRPKWLADVYSATDDRYLEEVVGNAESAVANGSAYGSPEIRSWLGAMMTSMQGLSCANPQSNDAWSTGKLGEGATTLDDNVTRLKLGVDQALHVCDPPSGDFGNGSLLFLRFNPRTLTTGTNDVDYTDFRDTMEYLSANYDQDQSADNDYSSSCNEPGNNVHAEYSKIVPLYLAFGGMEMQVDQGHDLAPTSTDPFSYDHTPRCGFFFDRFIPSEIPGAFPGSPAASASCSTYRGPLGVAQIVSGCSSDSTLVESWWDDDYRLYGYRQYTRRVLSPASCPVQNRTLAFVNAYPPAKTCDGAFQLLRAVAIACEASRNTGYLPITSAAPVVTDPLNVGPLSRWVDGRSAQIAQSISRLHLESVPTVLIKNFDTGTNGGTGLGGDIGTAQTKLSDSINTLASQLLIANGELATMKTSLDGYQSTIQGIQDEQVLADLQIAEKQLSTVRDIADSIAKGVEGSASITKGADSFGSANAAAALDAEVDVVSDLAMLGLISQQEDATNADARNKLRGALNQLGGSLQAAETQVSTALLAVRTAAADATDAGRSLVTTQQKAQFQLAVAAGADYVTNAAGEIVDLPVNTVMRRQFSATKQRYELALQNAKYLAYISRLAIEQRLGKRLSSLTSPIGALDAPANWADDICALTGVDYSQLSGQSLSPTGSGGSVITSDGGAVDSGSGSDASTGLTPAAGSAADQQVITDFAESFVGDYVTKLQNLVAYYNIQYPSHDGDDVAVLSLAENFSDQCTIPSTNLLFESGALATGLPPVAPNTILRGWSLFPCVGFTGKCLQSQPIGALSPAIYPPVASNSQAGTWLYDTTLSVPMTDAAPPEGGFDAGLPDAFAGGGDATIDVGSGDASTVPPEGGTKPIGPANPSGSTGQLVSLTAGGYVLSWWDQAGPTPGAGDAGYAWPTSAPVVPYRVLVLDPNGKVFAQTSIVPTFTGPPAVTSSEAGVDSSVVTSGGWSDRQTLTFTVPSGGDGNYTIVFRASDVPDLPGSVIIAEVQLEGGTTPTAYEDVSNSQVAYTNDCSLAPLASRPSITDRFEYVTDATGSYWQLKQPITIDTTKLGPGSASLGTSPASGSPGTVGSPFAQDNYNFRDTSISINLVGTNVHDCSGSPTPSCFADSYLDYTLEHQAAHAGIVGWDGLSQNFNFGVADVNHGKALAAERYITVPVSSADSALLFTPATEKVEFRGRPLDGTYRLKIWDSPFLTFGNLQDVQIVIKYVYWSPIQSVPSSGS